MSGLPSTCTPLMHLTEELGEAVAEYAAVRKKHDDARESCQVDWDYFGEHERNELGRATSFLAQAFDRYLDDYMRRKLLGSDAS